MRPTKFLDTSKGNTKGVDNDIITNSLPDPELNYVVQYPRVVTPPNMAPNENTAAYEVIHYPKHTRTRTYKVQEPSQIRTLNKSKYKTSYTYTKRKAANQDNNSYQSSTTPRNNENGAKADEKFYPSSQENLGIGGFSVNHPNFFSSLNSDFGWGNSAAGWPTTISSTVPPNYSSTSEGDPDEPARRNFVVHDYEDEDTTQTYSLRKTGN